MGPELLTISAGGATWTAFKRVVVHASLAHAARSFEIEIAFDPGAAAAKAAFGAGATISILANGGLLVTGFVDSYRPHIAKDMAGAIVEGRSKAADAIDGAAAHKTGRFENMTPLQIAQALDKAKVGFSATAQLQAIPLAQLRPGETVFACIERLCREQHVALRGMPSGGIDLWDATAPKRHSGALIEGVNLLTAEAGHIHTGRHSHYVVRGQKAKGTHIEDHEIEAVATDKAVTRFRPHILHVEEDITPARAKRRARAHRDRAAGRSLSTDVTVQGFRDDGGALWEPGRIIPMHSPTLDVMQDMLIETVAFQQDDKGSTTGLALVDPRAYAGSASRGSKSSSAWNQDDSDATITPPGTDSPIL